jgi:hypothetical protein
MPWDINDHLVNLKEKLKTWRDVYWRYCTVYLLLFWMDVVSCSDLYVYLEQNFSLSAHEKREGKMAGIDVQYL